jgi:hypothetical protein
MAVATVIYTVGTFLLWHTSRSNVKALESQLALLNTQLDFQVQFNRAVAHGATLDAHREIWLPVVSNRELLSLLQANPPDDRNRTAGELLGSIVINHCSRIFAHFSDGIFDASELPAFSRDARHLFSYPLVRWRWQDVAKYHSDDFAKFVHDNITS